MDIFHFILGPIRGVLVWFDSVVYGLIPVLYKLMLYLADVDIVSNNIPVQALIQRIYILIGVFMLFKLSFSILNYIVNPDAFSDQSKGFTNLVKRVMIAVVLLVSIPWIFTKLYDIQGEILTTNILSRFILGEATPVSNKNSKSNNNIVKTELETSIETSAKDVQFLLFGPFYSLNYNTDEFKEVCKPTPDRPSRHIIGSVDMGSDKDCLKKVAELMDTDDTIIAADVTLNDFFRYEGDKEDKRDFSQFTDLASWTLSNGEFAINYNPIISTLCGGYLVFLLLSFCIDIAGRIFRLLFLQILSPVAVISSIDPTSSGDRLKEWAKECFKVWVSLFLRLAIIFLIIQLVRVVTNTIYSNSFQINGYSNSNGIPVWIYIFLILGIFNAAGKIPELIEKATGIKMSGEIQLNPLKTLNENRGLGLAAGVGIGTVGWLTGGGFGRVLSGAYKGLTSSTVSDVQKQMVEGNRVMRNARSDGSNFFGRVGARFTNLIGSQGALGRVEDEKVREENNIHQLENEKMNIENNIRGVRDEISQRQAVQTAISKIKDRASSKARESDEYVARMNEVEAKRTYASNMTKGASESDRDFVSRRNAVLAEAQQMEAAANKWAATVGAQEWLNGDGRNDAATYAAMQEYQTAAEQAGLISYDYGEGSEIWSQDDDITVGVANATRLISGQEQQIKNIDQQIQDHQNEIKRIDQEHRRVESNYKAVGGQSGGTTVPNATSRSDAGQHYGSTNFFGPMGPPSGGGYGSGPHGPGGPYGPRP